MVLVWFWQETIDKSASWNVSILKKTCKSFFFPEDFEQYVNLNCYILYIFCQRVSVKVFAQCPKSVGTFRSIDQNLNRWTLTMLLNGLSLLMLFYLPAVLCSVFGADCGFVCLFFSVLSTTDFSLWLWEVDAQKSHTSC